MLLPRKGHFELIDYEKAYAPDLMRNKINKRILNNQK